MNILENVPEAAKWLAGGGVGVLATWWFNLRRQSRQDASDATRFRVFDSGLEYNAKELRRQLEDAKAEIIELKGDLKHRGIEVIDLMQQRYELGMRVAALEAEKGVLFKQHAKAAVLAVAAMPALRGVEVTETLKDTGFGDLT